MTFFPYYVKSRISTSKVNCCDSDQTLGSIFASINDQTDSDVQFSDIDIHSMQNDDCSFDIIYCISVLEHTKSYNKIIDEFYRVLKPGGKLIVTFDISLDGKGDIIPEQAVKLLNTLCQKFESDDEQSDIPSVLSTPGILTTEHIVTVNEDLLPWKRPTVIGQIKSILKGRGYQRWPKNFTVYCLSLTK